MNSFIVFFKFSLGTQDTAADIQDSAPLSKHPRKWMYRF